jgi:hypothetical protein
MNSYNITIQDIYEKNKQKYFVIEEINTQLAHKAGLKYTNALREEISLIRDCNNNIVFSFRDGFIDINE